jgi:hypothetical protein
MAASFVHGKNFVDVFDTELGPVRVVALVMIENDHLVLNDFSIFPKGRTIALPIGVPQVVRIVGQIKRSAKQAGFTRMTVRAERLTGANPGRMITIERSLV